MAPMTDTPAAVPARRWLRRGAWALLGMLLAAGLLLGGALAWWAPQLPPLDKVTTYQPRQPLQVFTSDGVEIAQFGTERRQFVPVAQIPPLLREAVVSVEDRRFREHHGIDWRGIGRAVLANLGGRREGASTITQQVARTFFLSARQTPERKLKEAMLAMRIERQLSKDQILELYLNQIYLGQRAYGYAAAAATYFGKPLDALSVAEVAMLAGLPQNPAYANPITNLERATRRQREVLQRMLSGGVITEAQASAARAEVIKIRSPLQTTLHAEHVAEMARLAVVERFGAEVYSQGIRVTTSLRAADQQAAWAAVRRGVLAYDARQPWRGPEDTEELPGPGASDADLERAAAQALKDHRDDELLRVAIVLDASPKALRLQLASGEQLRLTGDSLRVAQPGLAAKADGALKLERGDVIRVAQASDKPDAPWAVVQWPEVQAAFVAMDAGSGRVRALVGGFDFAQQPFNHVTQAWRQPGSSFKPFLYSAALDNGLVPATLVNDAPLDDAGGWQPANSDGRFDGPLTLREALARSKNLVSVRVLQALGVPTVLAWAGRFGFEAKRQPDNLTLALGAGSTTPLQLAQAYAVLANGGWRVNPVVIERITDAQGKLLFEADPPTARDDANRAVPARNVWLTNSLLNGVTQHGTAARAQQQLQRQDVYGKTGTTNDAVDAWFAGFQTDGAPGSGLVAVAWMGHDEPASLGSRESGGGLSLPIWLDYMAAALKGVPNAGLPPPPEGLVEVDGDWRYADWADRRPQLRIGLPPEPEPPAAGTAATASDTAASAPR
jgi:penicillin-binding protein 1A